IGATGPTPCAGGRYTAVEGATACQVAIPGYYAPGPGATAQLPSPLGHFVAASGANQPTPAPSGRYVGVTAATASSACTIGTYSGNTGASACTPAPAGSFVNTSAATAATPCAPGRYTGVAGATVCDIAAIGYYAPGPGATAPLPAPLGHYVGVTGAGVATPAAAGYYVGITGATASVACLAGTYSGGSAASACTPAPAGWFAAGSAATAAVPCSPGRYSAATGATACAVADPGYYVATTGSTAQVAAAAGYFVGSAGANAPVAAPIGFYVAVTAATAPVPCPAGSQSFGASIACRDTGGGAVGTVGPQFEYELPASILRLPGLAPGASALIPVRVRNAANTIGSGNPLTRLTLLGLAGTPEFSTAALASQPVLDEGASLSFDVGLAPARVGSFDASFGVRTDQAAALGQSGAVFNRRVIVSVSGTDVALRAYALTPYSMVGQAVELRLLVSNDGDVDAPALPLATIEPAGLACQWAVHERSGGASNTARLPEEGPLVDLVTLPGSSGIEYQARCQVLEDSALAISAQVAVPPGDVDPANNAVTRVAREQLSPDAPLVSIQITGLAAPNFLWLDQVRTWWRVDIARLAIPGQAGANRLNLGVPFGIGNVTWQCTATAPATCPLLPAPGTTSHLSRDIGMPPGGSLSFTLGAPVTQYEGVPVTLTATASYNDPVDRSLQVVRAQDTVRVAPFGNGFE
ncbi:MAG: hypothetical protein KA162_08220, partial [Xanthomonadales bacterium]|nr:hypothetical protein [Xanthomonadales bacterium]